MALGKLKPKFFRLVQKPSNAAASELAKATPIYIEGLGAGGGDPLQVEVTFTDPVTNKSLTLPVREWINELALSGLRHEQRIVALEAASA